MTCSSSAVHKLSQHSASRPIERSEEHHVYLPADFNAKIIDEFHANEGRVGGVFEGIPLLLLHHTGARSGESRINPLAYQSDDGRYVVFASKGGALKNPNWYHNLKAHPNVTIEVGTSTIDAVASEATGLSASASLANKSSGCLSSPSTRRRPGALFR